MTATPAEPLPPHLVWINGPHGIGRREWLEWLRDDWSCPVFDADELGHVLRDGLPRAMDPGELQELRMWLRSILLLGTELARAWRPLVVMRSTVHDPGTVGQLLGGFRGAGG